MGPATRYTLRHNTVRAMNIFLILCIFDQVGQNDTIFASKLPLEGPDQSIKIEIIKELSIINLST